MSKITPTPDGPVSPAVAGEILGVCDTTIRRMMKLNEIAYYRIGRRICIDRSEVARIREESYVPAKLNR